MISCCMAVYRCCPPTATHSPIPCSGHPVGRNRGETQTPQCWCDVDISVCICNLCMMASRIHNYLQGILQCVELTPRRVSPVIGVSWVPPTQVKRFSLFLKELAFFYGLHLPEEIKLPFAPPFSIKIRVTVTFSPARAWFVPSMYGAAFLFLMAWRFDS